MATGSSNTYSLSTYNIHAKSNHTLPIMIIQLDSATTFRTNSPYRTKSEDLIQITDM